MKYFTHKTNIESLQKNLIFIDGNTFVVKFDLLSDFIDEIHFFITEKFY